VRGHHLGQWMRYLSIKGRSAPSEILIQIVIDVLDALHHAHNQRHPDGSPMQIVHRDVSPSNILLDDNGRGRLLDFGVARMRGGAHDYKTQVKGFMGKLPYTAPEIFAGNEATPQSDLYACAVVLHEVLFGRNVFRTESQAATLHTVMTHTPEPLEPIRQVPAGLDAVLAKALAKNPVERFISARELASSLRRLQREQESEIRARLATLLKEDFSREMADLLKIESLAERDDAWRRLSLRPPQVGKQDEGGATEMRSASRPRRITRDRFRDPGPSDGGPSASGERTPGRPLGLPAPPPAIDATVASSPRGPRELQPQVAHAVAMPPIGAPPPAVAPPIQKIHPRPSAASAPLPMQETTASVSRRPAPNQRLLFAAFGVTACLAVAAIVVSLQGRGGDPIVATTPAIRVVETPIEAPLGAVPPAAEPAPATAEAEPEPEPQPESAAGEPRKPRGPDPRDLTRAFRKQQPKIESCFEQHALTLQGQPRLQLEFDLSAKGKLTAVALTPVAVAGTALGKCLEGVARATTFPPQGEDISFAIPVVASRQ